MPVAAPRPDRPLAGLRVVDLSRLLPGPMCAWYLRGMGAEVIKVEQPGVGDYLRHMPPFGPDGLGLWFSALNAGCRSVALDLKRDAEALHPLLETADVLIEGFRPGVMEQMGLGPEALHEINPKLVIGRISGWGHSGPYRHKPGFGTLAEGYSGFAAISGFGDREPLLPAIFLADMTTGLHGAYALMVALWHVRVNGGAGQVIELSLLDSLLSILGPLAANHKLTGKVKPRTGSRSTTNCPRNVYQTSDGKWMALSASTQRTAERLFRVIGREDMIADPRFDSNSARLRNVEEVDHIVGGFIRSQTLAENLELFDREEITVGPVYDSSDLAHDDYIIEREALVEYEDPEVGFIPMHAVTARMSATPGAMRRPAPSVGEHTREIFEPLIGADAYRDLLASGALLEKMPRDSDPN
jgi:formyl-CoA transferase